MSANGAIPIEIESEDNLKIDFRLKLVDFLKSNKNCRFFADYISSYYHDDVFLNNRTDLVVGFGMVSHEYGLSMGPPIDIYNMLLSAINIKKQVLPQDSKIHILIADHLAFSCEHSSCSDKNLVKDRVNKYVNKLSRIVKRLGLNHDCLFHFSSEIIKTDEYQMIREDLNQKVDKIISLEWDQDTSAILKEEGPRYDSSHRSYFLDQTALCQYLYDFHHCGLKISWSRNRARRDILKSNSFDEAHFDRFYRTLFHSEIHKLSFIYTRPGYAVCGQGTEIPYTAPNKGKERILLTLKQSLSTVDNSNLLETIQENVKCIESLSQSFEKMSFEGTPIHRDVLFLRLLASKKATVMLNPDCFDLGTEKRNLHKF